MAKKHTKPNPNAGIEGGIIEKEMPIELSNIMPVSYTHLTLPTILLV